MIIGMPPFNLLVKRKCLNRHFVYYLQVFLLDVQRSHGLVVDYEREEDRSYIFLIYPPAYVEKKDPTLVSRYVSNTIFIRT